MKILLVSATTHEIAPFLNALGNPLRAENERLSSYLYQNHHIDVLITGVGMVFTAFYLGQQLAKQTYDLVINAGVAGTIDKSLKIGAVVQVVHDYFYELGAEDHQNWLSIGELGLLTAHDLPYTAEGLINNPMPWPVIDQLQKVKAHTVNRVHGNEQSIQTMFARSRAQVETMEGAAFLFCCLKMKRKCFQIRAISNEVEPRNKENWQMKEAINNLNLLLIDFLEQSN